MGAMMKWLAVAIGIWGLAGCGDAAPARDPERASKGIADPRPNIVLLMAEDLGPRIGAYGDPVAHTPNIDRLAREGVRHTRAFTTAGVCSPSRAAMITGLHQNTWGAGHMRAARGGYTASPPAHVKAFPELLRAHGYFTVNDGKTDYQMGLRGFGAFGGPETLWDESRSGDWSGRAPGQPFFAYVNLGQTHESQVWPTWMPPESLLTAVLWPLRLVNHMRWPLETAPERVAVPPYYPDTPTVRADIARHYNNIATMDAAVGALLRRLEREGISQNTVVIFASDHGDGLPRAKRWLYDAGIHVPLIVRWPGVTTPGEARDRLISMIDLAPTILAMADVEVPSWLEGRIFVGPRENTAPAYIHAARDRIDDTPDTVRAVRDERFKYIRHEHPEKPYVAPSHFRDQMPMMKELLALHEADALEGAPALWLRPRRDAEELFDTQTDPHEIANLAFDPAYASTLARMRAAFDDWRARHDDLGYLPEEALRKRFFPDGAQPTTATPRLEIVNGLVRATSETPGASIEIRVGDGRWRLYTNPMSAAAGVEIEARAQRHGWKASDVTRIMGEAVPD